MQHVWMDGDVISEQTIGSTLADHYSGDRDELKPFIADFIDTHAPDLFDERADNGTDYAREERTWGL